MFHTGDHTCHEGHHTVVEYDRQLDIRNLDQLPTGCGARYLEVLPIRDDTKMVYIAKYWRRRPLRGTVVIEF